MPAITVYADAGRGSTPHPKASLRTAGGVAFEFPYAPREVDHDGLAPAFAQLSRPGRKPIVRRAAPPARTMSYTALLARRDHQESVEDLIAGLRRVADSGDRLTLAGMGPLEGGTWRLAGLSLASALRQHGTNHITRATVSLSFIEAVDAVVNVGPVSGGHVKPAPPRPPAAPERVHVFVRGDTCWELARRYYGNPLKWPIIAQRNGIRDVRRIPIGFRAVIPTI